MSNFKIYTIGFLIILNIAFSFGIVLIEHLTRSQYRQLQYFSNQKYELRNEWKKARIDQGIYASYSKIEENAKISLKMFLPKNRKLIYIDD